MRGCWLVCALLLMSTRVQAEPPISARAPELELQLASPYESTIRNHYYALLARSPAKSFLWELALPGAGHVYSGFYVQAAISAGITLTGASLWIAGAVRDDEQLWWAGAGTFAAGRLYGLISAPISAALLNAAFRRQFGITRRF